MKKLVSLIFLISLAGIVAKGQTDSPGSKPLSKNFFMEIGGNYSSFQDQKYSNVRYSGVGTALSLGYNKSTEKYFWETGLNLNFSKENAKTHSSGKTTVLNPSLYFKYLRSLKKSFLIGGRLDIIDYYNREIEGLGNNGSYNINGSHLYASLMYKKELGDNWNLQASLDLGLLSYMRESTSFGFSAPQNGLEDGEFSYQNEELEDSFGFKYFELKPIGEIANIKTSFLFQYKDRIAIGYKWQMKRFATLESYSVTKGSHSIVFRYNIVRK